MLLTVTLKKALTFIVYTVGSHLYNLDYCFATIMACNLEKQMRRTFNMEELVANSVKLVFCHEELAGDRVQITVFPIATEHLYQQHRTGLLSRIVQRLLGWSRYIQRIWRYFLECTTG